ncbi:MAG: hypothetical protein JWN76_3680 [Chitinophagaceae bacterium]|nr:hypothetical protein [Chitinophagaceae bacterium]
MKLPWFKMTGLFMKPISVAGWLIFIAAILYLAWTFYDIDSRSHSVSDTLINWVFNGLIIGVAYTIVAGLTLLFNKRNV